MHKANTALAFLRHNLKSCSLYIKTKYYQGTFRPIIEYVYTVWAPYTTQDINKIEMIQRRAARFVYNKYTCTIILLVFPTCSNHLAGTLYQQEDTTLITYKIHNTMISIQSANFKPVTVTI